LKSDAADGAFFINAASASNSDEDEDSALDDVDGAFDRRDVVESDRREEASPLNDVLNDMANG
jgi:hypothetical protein